jgi:hypothetical protein
MRQLRSDRGNKNQGLRLRGQMKKLLHLLLIVFGAANLSAAEVTYINLDRVVIAPYSENAILRKDSGFIDDFLTLHSLLRMAEPKSVFEIGTCTGEGTLIIKNAIGSGVVYSLDLPIGQSDYDLPVVGAACHLPFVQLFGDSSTFDYGAHHPIEAWFIDGAHDYVHVVQETKEALKSNPKLIVWHDSDIPEVLLGIQEGLSQSKFLLYRVRGTRIAFAIPNASKLVDSIHD